VRPNATLVQQLGRDLRDQLTVFVIALYLRPLSLTWDRRKPLCRFQSRLLVLINARDLLNVNPPNRLDSTCTSLRSTPLYSGRTEGCERSIYIWPVYEVYKLYLRFCLALLNTLPGKKQSGAQNLECSTRRTHSVTFSIFLFFSERIVSMIARNSGVRSVPK
jgi:hypothetical protein